MFIVSSNRTFTHPVKVMVPVDGGHKEQSFKTTFRVIDADADERDLTSAAGSTSFLKEVVIGMDELVDDQEQAVPYSDELRDRMLKLPFVRVALARAYMTAVSKAPTGN